MSRSPRFEVVRTRGGWHARFRAANSQIVWVTEPYERRRGAVRAVDLIAHTLAEAALVKTRSIEVRYVDER